MLRNTNADQLVAKLGQVMPGLGHDRLKAFADRMVRETDERLEPNVLEWLCDEPLTDIWIGQYCIGLVLKVQGRGDFLTALEALNCYASDPDLGERLIWRAIQ